jgi:hypothetical protein
VDKARRYRFSENNASRFIKIPSIKATGVIMSALLFFFLVVPEVYQFLSYTGGANSGISADTECYREVLGSSAIFNLDRMKLRIFSALVFLVASAGWNQAFPAAKSGKTQIQNQHLTDSQMEGVLHTKLAKSKMANEGWTVHVHNHVVTWEGKTNVIQHKGAATRMAHTAGATEVVNNIKISEAARLKAAERLAKNRDGGQPVKHAAVIASK